MKAHSASFSKEQRRTMLLHILMQNRTRGDRIHAWLRELYLPPGRNFRSPHHLHKSLSDSLRSRSTAGIFWLLSTLFGHHLQIVWIGTCQVKVPSQGSRKDAIFKRFFSVEKTTGNSCLLCPRLPLFVFTCFSQRGKKFTCIICTPWGIGQRNKWRRLVFWISRARNLAAANLQIAWWLTFRTFSRGQN